VLHRFRGPLGLHELLEGGEVGDLEDHPKMIIGQRLKQSGMRWTVASAVGIAGSTQGIRSLETLLDDLFD
jgi:hypothetical protein